MKDQYAAMVEMIDTNVGRIISFLEKAGELDNTVSQTSLMDE